MIGSLFRFVSSAIKLSINGTDVTIEGTGEISQSDVRVGPYEKYTSITIKQGPTGFKESSLKQCEALETISISYSIKSIPSQTFGSNKKLKEFIVPDDHEYYRIDSQKALYTKNMSILVHVPSQISEFVIPETVEKIPGGCFGSCDNLKNLNIPKRVQYLEKDSFAEYRAYGTVTFSKGSLLTEIPSRSFWYSGISILHVPPSVTKICRAAFSHSSFVQIIFDDMEESNLTVLEDSSFSQFHGTSITLPPKVQRLPDSVFAKSSRLTMINIPKECCNISSSAFTGCSALTSITVDNGSLYFKSIDDAIYDFAVEYLLFLPPTLTNFTVPSTVSSFSGSSLQGSKNLTSINTDLNDRFYSEGGVLYTSNRSVLLAVGGGVKTVTVLPEVTEISSGAFSTVGVTEVTMNDKITTIRDNAFLACTKLKHLSLPKTISLIGASSFEGCYSNAIDIPADAPIKELPTRCFFQSYLTEFTMPDAVSSLGYQCFCSMQYLQRVIVSKKSQLTSIGYAFNSCKNLESFGAPPLLRTVSAQAFAACKKLAFPFEQCPQLSRIESKAFEECNHTSIVFSSSISVIDNFAFSNNKFLESVSFSDPSIIKSLTSSSFMDCIRLTSFRVPSSLQTISPYVFSGCASLQNIDCDEQCDSFESDDGLLYTKGLKELIICPPGRIEASVSPISTKVGTDAIKDCSRLTKITFLKNSHITEFASNIFSGCASLSIVTLPDSLLTIHRNCFSKIEALTTIKFYETNQLQKIEEEAFSDCSSLSQIAIPPNVLQIGAGAFSGCTSLCSLPIRSAINNGAIPERCFAKCAFNSLTIPQYITSIGSFSFAGCASITCVVIGAQCTSIGDEAFSQCSKIELIKFCGLNNIGQPNSFLTGIPVYVRRAYKDEVFCGLDVYYALSDICEVIPASASLSVQFTGHKGPLSLTIERVFPVLLGDLGGDK